MSQLVVTVSEGFAGLTKDRNNPEYFVPYAVITAADGALTEFLSWVPGPYEKPHPTFEVDQSCQMSDFDINVELTQGHLTEDQAKELLLKLIDAVDMCPAYISYRATLVVGLKFHFRIFSPDYSVEMVRV